MKKDQKRKAVLTARANNEALAFLTRFGAKTRIGELTPAMEQRIDEELLVLKNLGVSEDLITLKNAMESVRKELNVVSEPSKGILCGSLVAYCLGLEPTNPLETQAELNPMEFKIPLQLTVSFDNQVRNQVVEWLRGHGFEITTQIGQPLLKLTNTRVTIRRVVKP